MFASAAEALKYIKDKDLAMVDLKITGVAGQWLHISIPARQFSQRHLEEGVGYDGSSGAGFSRLESGDVVARPLPETAFIDPFMERPTLISCARRSARTPGFPFPATRGACGSNPEPGDDSRTKA